MTFKEMIEANKKTTIRILKEEVESYEPENIIIIMGKHRRVMNEDTSAIPIEKQYKYITKMHEVVGMDFPEHIKMFLNATQILFNRLTSYYRRAIKKKILELGDKP